MKYMNSAEVARLFFLRSGARLKQGTFLANRASKELSSTYYGIA